MGQRGPRPKPTALFAIEGGKPSHRAVKNEAKPDIRMPMPPAAIVSDREAFAEWRRAGSELVTLGLVSNLDRAVLAAYCFSYSRYMAAERAVQMEAKADAKRRGKRRVGAEGLIIRTQSGNLIQNPAVGIANKAGAQVLRYAIELGLTPSARTRIKPGTAPLDSGEDQDADFD